MNLMSSMAKTFVGSIIAMVIVAPALVTGRMVYLRAMSAGMILMTASSISMPSRIDRRHAEVLGEEVDELAAR